MLLLTYCTVPREPARIRGLGQCSHFLLEQRVVRQLPGRRPQTANSFAVLAWSELRKAEEHWLRVPGTAGFKLTPDVELIKSNF